jgi:hypothetical protein
MYNGRVQQGRDRHGPLVAAEDMQLKRIGGIDGLER